MGLRYGDETYRRTKHTPTPRELRRRKKRAKPIRKQPKDNKQKWIESTLEDGNWNAIKTFKRIQNKKSKLQFRHENGDVIHPTDQADAMATHYETMQWYVRPGCGTDDKPMINETKLDTVDSAITRDELYHVLKLLKRNKAARTDGIPAELWKLLLDNDDAAERFLLLFN